jgi:hypothetical protein
VLCEICKKIENNFDFHGSFVVPSPVPVIIVFRLASVPIRPRNWFGIPTL